MSGIETAMTLIAGAGESRSFASEAIAHARQSEFGAAWACLEKAKDAMVAVHDTQTDLIRQEMTGNGSENLSLLMIHAQDHLTTAMLMRELAEEFILLYEKINAPEGRS
jgi:PTS system cellobiose-specific IIA component